MELFALYFNLFLFYFEFSFGFWITWILLKENPKIESFRSSADLLLDNIREIYIYIIYIYIYKLKSFPTTQIFMIKNPLVDS